MTSPRRPWYPTKAAWAAAQAQKCRDAIAALQAQQIPAGEWRRINDKVREIDRLRAEAVRWDGKAARFAAQAA